MKRRPLALTLSAGLLVGCNSAVHHNPKVTRANSAAIQNGMSLAEVEQILGPSDSMVGGTANVGGKSLKADQYEWLDDKAKIDVAFSDGKVVEKSDSGL